MDEILLVIVTGAVVTRAALVALSVIIVVRAVIARTTRVTLLRLVVTRSATAVCRLGVRVVAVLVVATAAERAGGGSEGESESSHGKCGS